MLATRLEVFFNIVLYCLICAVLLGALSKKKPPRNNVYLGVLLILLFFLFAFWGGDYFHYEEGYNLIKSNTFFTTSLEDVYYWIISITPSYFFFRLIIWGGCLALYMKILSLLKIPIGIGLLSFAAFALLRLSYARVSLAMAMMYAGLAFFVCANNNNNNNKKRAGLFGILLIVSSFYFHKSAYFGIFMILSSAFLTFIKNKGVGYFMIIAIFIVSFLLVRYYIGDLMMASIDAEESNFSMEVGQKYLGRDGSETGWGGRIRDFAEMIPYYVGLFIYFRLRIKGSLRECPTSMLMFANLFVIITLVSSVFMFDYGYNTVFLYHRFMRFNLIPLAIFMAFCYTIGYERTLVKYNCIIAMLVSLFTLYYSFQHALS